MDSLRQGALQVLQWVQALDFAASAIDELPKGVLLQQGLHVLEEEALTEQGQLWGVVDLWAGRELRPMVFVYPSPTSDVTCSQQGSSLTWGDVPVCLWKPPSLLYLPGVSPRPIFFLTCVTDDTCTGQLLS